MSKGQYRRTLAPIRKRNRRPLGLFLIAFGLLLSVGGIVRVSALPAEARIQQTWFAYRQELAYDFTSRVTKGTIYSSETVGAEELLRTKAPVDPPIYRRVLVSQLTDSITIKLPYRFTADRPATINANYRVDGVLMVSNLWQRPYPLIPPQTVSASGTELAISDMNVTIPIRNLIQELEGISEQLKLGQDQVELKIRPVIQVTVDGQKQPVSTTLTPEFAISIRGLKLAIEVDEPKLVDENKSFTEMMITPLTVNVFGRAVPFNTVRNTSIILLTILALVLGGTLLAKWLRGRAAIVADLSRLGSALVVGDSFQISEDVVLVDVQSVSQLINIHLRTDRPVIRVENTCYLVDGSTCYRLRLLAGQAEPAD